MKKTWMKGAALLCAAVMTLSFAQSGFAQEESAEEVPTGTESVQESEEPEDDLQNDASEGTEEGSEALESEEQNTGDNDSDNHATENQDSESEYEGLEWTVVFDAGEGAFEDGEKTKTYIAMDGEYLDNVCPYSSPTAEGKEFVGWSRDENSKEVLDDLFVWYQVHQDVTFYAVWNDAYTITLDAGEGFFYEEDNKTETAQIQKGEMIGTLQAPWIEESAEKAFDCYCFDKEGNNPIPNDYVPDKDMTVYARWKGTYKVTFDAGEGELYCGDGEVSKQKTILVGVGDSLDSVYSSFYRFENPYIDDKFKKAFKGWSTDPSGNSIIGEGKLIYLVPEGDMTLYAVWMDTYQITYVTEEGYFEGDEDLKTVQELVGKGKPIEYHSPWCDISPDSKKAFAGWATDAKGENIISRYDLGPYVPTEDMTIYAIWKDAYTINFVTEEGEFSDGTKSESYNVVKGERLEFMPDVFYQEGLHARWAADPEGKNMVSDLYEFVPDKDMTLYAIWKNKAYVSFDTREGQFAIEDPDEQKFVTLYSGAEGDTLYSLHFNWEVIPPAHKVFAGWATDPEGKNLIKDEKNYIISDGEIFYASWEEVKTIPVLQVDHNREDKLTGVKVNGEKVDENDYIIRQDGNNIVIELTEAFKETLPAGAKITAEFDSGSYDGEVAAGEIMNYAILSVENQDQEVEVRDGSSNVIGSVDEVVVEASGPFEALDQVAVNGKVLQRDEQYVATPGSTIITFTDKYLKTLKAGEENAVTISYKDGGTAKTTFVMEAAPEEEIKETETEKETVKETETETVRETESETVKETEKETVKESETEKAKESETKAEKGTSSSGAVKTGDQTPLTFLAIMLVASALAVVAILGRKRIRK